MSDKAWKAFERRLARDVGVERIPVSGRWRAEADFVDDGAAYQAKLVRGMPAYVREWLDGIVGTARRTGRIGVVVWKEPGQLDADAVVFLRWSDYCRLAARKEAA